MHETIGTAPRLAGLGARRLGRQPGLAPGGPAGRGRGRGAGCAPADVASVDAIVAALYDVISGPAGAPRDWDRMRSLFAPRRQDGGGRRRARTAASAMRA